MEIREGGGGVINRLWGGTTCGEKTMGTAYIPKANLQRGGVNRTDAVRKDRRAQGGKKIEGKLGKGT